MTTIETYARELWEAAGADDAIGIPAAIFHRFNADHGIELTDPCERCHGADGGHESWCGNGQCVHCGGNPCVCDAWVERIHDATIDDFPEYVDGEDA